ncbi:hypothetical protein [Vulgatibacter sp.]|uniref:DNA polymerase Y family protein n=1 Tax=Vulgatibacter sp. TaxID=1971226 RepID=UPI0035698F2E
MRIGCLFVPDLPLQALLRAEPTLAGIPLAVAEGEGARARIAHVSVQARTQGVTPGMGVGDALAFCPQLTVRWVAPEIVEATREAVLDAAASVAPRVEEVRPGLALIDAEGLSRLHGDERGIASALVAAASRLDLEAQASVAGGKHLATIAAVRGAGIEVIPKGRERTFLAPLPLAAIGASPRLCETLVRWGLATAGAFATLPIDGVGARLGEEGVRVHRLATGHDDEPLQPRPQPETFEEGCDFDFEILAIEGLLFVIRPALERLVSRLDCYGVAVGGLTLKLLLDPAGESLLPVELAAPTRDVGSMLALCRSVLERKPPNAAIRGIRVLATPARSRREQLRLFGLPTVAPEKLATAVAKVASIVGDDRIGMPLLRESHDPEGYRISRFDPPPPPEEEPDLGPVAEGVAGLRLFRPPLEAEVRMGREGPQAIRAGAVAGWIVGFAGPWRLDTGWHERPVQRDTFDVELSDGAVYRLAQDCVSGSWSLVGRYD